MSTPPASRIQIVKDEPAVIIVLVLLAAFLFFVPQGTCGFTADASAAIDAPAPEQRVIE